MPASLPMTKLDKAFYRAPAKWLEDRGISADMDALAALLEPREQALIAIDGYKEKTGKLSREIGGLKKAGQPADDLIDEMKAYKTKLKAHDEVVRQAEESVVLWVEQQLDADSQDAEVEAAQAKAQELDHSLLAVTELNDELRPACLEYLEKLPEATLYHHPEWCDLVLQSFGHGSNYYVAHISGEVVGVLPVVNLKSRLFGSFGISMPYFNYGGPLGETGKVISELLKVAEGDAANNGINHIEYRCLKPLAALPGHQNKVSMCLDLPGSSEQLWQDLGAKVRSQINKAQPHNFSVHIGGLELLDDFYRVFAINMRDLGTPVYAKSFFQHIFATQVGKKNIIVLRNSTGEAISASFVIGYKGQLEVPWASTLRKYNTANANMMLYWQMLKFACDEGYKVFDFGRSSLDASTYRFKKQWGTRPVQLHWHYWLAEGGELPQLNPNNPKYKLVIWAWQKLPVWLTKVVGPFIVKNLP